jgi:proteic killer suppression protein
MWPIYEHRRAARQVKSIPINILKRYEKWKDIVNVSGPDGLRFIGGFHDEALRGEWKGVRSSRFGKQFRVIYKVERGQVLVQVINIYAHD